MVEKYPIGTRIITDYTNTFRLAELDNGCVGIIVGIKEGDPLILIENSLSKQALVWKGIDYTWWSTWRQIKRIRMTKQMFFKF